MKKPFVDGELALFVDRKKRQNLVVLRAGEMYHTHTGVFSLDDVIGQPEGVEVTTTGGARYLAVRPTLADYIVKMPRGAQVIYPKDLGPILTFGDIGAGMTVLESGVGSGALSMSLLRSGATVLGYEIREDFAAIARRNVAAFCGEDLAKNYSVEVRDIYESVDCVRVDRVVLDLPEPWRVVPHASHALRPGGILVSYVPSVVQVSQLHEALRSGGFLMTETIEVLQRSWHVEGRAIRPDHRMVAHTGFLTRARYLPIATESDDGDVLNEGDEVGQNVTGSFDHLFGSPD